MAQLLKDKHREYNNSDIAVIAVYRLGGALHHMHLEDVALKAAELAPKSFSWKKYPEQINLEAVRISLKNELSSQNRRVIGSIRDGWMLTPHGLSWCLANATEESNQAWLNQLRKQVGQAKKTLAYSKTISNKGVEVSTADVKALLRIDDYFSSRNRRERIVALSNAAILDSELSFVLTDLRKRGFADLEV